MFQILYPGKYSRKKSERPRRVGTKITSREAKRRVEGNVSSRETIIFACSLALLSRSPRKIMGLHVVYEGISILNLKDIASLQACFPPNACVRQLESCLKCIPTPE